MATIDDLRKKVHSQTPGDRKVTFLPEPDRQRRKYTIISADDHLVEPRDMFVGRMPRALEGKAPEVLDIGGCDVWVYEDRQFPNIGVNAVVGRPVAEYSLEPTRYEDMRPGAWEIGARVQDMDISGVYASLCFPSALPGFAGQHLQLSTSDPDLALATIRAWNEWNLEVWCGTYPGRMIPCQLPYLLDPELGAKEVRRNAERGFKALTFSEAPHLIGLPSVHSGHWDPIMRACAETETVVNLHVGSSGATPSTSEDAPPDVVGALFFGYAMFAAADWLYSQIPVRFPDIKIVLSEGGIGWVPALLDRLDHMLRYQEIFGSWTGVALTPAEVLKRNFWFCALDDPSTFAISSRIGIDHILTEEDYPHADSSWPYTQRMLDNQIGALDLKDAQKVAWENASVLYRHEVPASVQLDPECF